MAMHTSSLLLKKTTKVDCCTIKVLDTCYVGRYVCMSWVCMSLFCPRMRIAVSFIALPSLDYPGMSSLDSLTGGGVICVCSLDYTHLQWNLSL